MNNDMWKAIAGVAILVLLLNSSFIEDLIVRIETRLQEEAKPANCVQISETKCLDVNKMFEEILG